VSASTFGPDFHQQAVGFLYLAEKTHTFLVAFTGAGRTFAAPVFSWAGRWMWRSQCFRHLPLHDVDDDVLEVVDVLLIGINSWWIHPLRETAVLSLSEYYKKQENVTKPKKDGEQICGHCLPKHVGSARSNDQSCSSLVHLHHAEIIV
jgi:hypothetical protein